MSAERAYNPLPSPSEPRIPSPIRPDISGTLLPPIQPPLPEGMIRFPIEQTRAPRPYFLAPETPLHEILDYTDIPRPSERYRAGKTALHESHHVLLGVSMGIQVEEVSVIPGPGYLGVTVFKGDLNHRPDALQIIAAGGAVTTLDGEAEGYGHHQLPGSDLHIAHNVSHITGKSAESAVQEASSRLARIPKEVRQIVADIIETKKTVYSPEYIHRIIEIAFFEAQLGIFPEYIEQEIATRKSHNTPYNDSVQRGTITTIITPTDGPQYVIIEEKKNPLDELSKDFQCGSCSGKKTHTAECKHNNGDTNTEHAESDDTDTVLPTTADIFIRKKHLRFLK